MSDFSDREGFCRRAGSGAGLAVIDDVVSISMVGSCVSIRSTQLMDAARTSVVVGAVNAAVEAGSVVCFAPSDGSVPPPAPIESSTSDPGSIGMDAVGAGLAVVHCAGSRWTIDMSAHRFLRSDHPLDLHFVPAAAWIPFDALWVSGDSVSACLAPGRYVTARRSVHRVTSIGRPDVDRSFDRIAS